MKNKGGVPSFNSVVGKQELQCMCLTAISDININHYKHINLYDMLLTMQIITKPYDITGVSCQQFLI